MQFLWIDRYCIPDDQVAEHLQISMLDVIYESVELTIIAADGDDANSGLTGISEARDRQPALRLGSWQLTSLLPDPNLAIKRSKWCTRGWTYQEGLLSRRRLYFSRGQAYLECLGSTFQESVQEPEASSLTQGTYPELKKLDTEPGLLESVFRVVPAAPRKSYAIQNL